MHEKFFHTHIKRFVFLVRDGFVYACIGAICLVLDFLLYGFLTRVFHIQYIVANILSFLLIAVLNYFGNRHFTYREQGKFEKKQLWKFLLIASVGVFLNTLFLALFFEYLHIYDFLSKLMATGVVFFWNFGMNRYWTFRRKQPLPYFDPL